MQINLVKYFVLIFSVSLKMNKVYSLKKNTKEQLLP